MCTSKEKPSVEQLVKVYDLLLGKGVNAHILQQDILERGVLSDVAEAAVRGTLPTREEFRKLLKLADPRFKLLNTFSITVPDWYDHATRLDAFRARYEKEFYSFNSNITDKNFSKATITLVPGQRFTVKVFQITERVSSKDCLDHLRSENAKLLGAQGVSLAYEQGKEQLPVGRWAVSFDEREALWEDADGDHRVPYVYRFSDGGFEFRLGIFEDYWDDCHCLLSFCDLPAGE